MNNEEIAVRPEWNKHIKGRNLVWYHRECSAYDLAARVCSEDGVTVTEAEKAEKLLDQCQRYALADAAQWERSNTSEHYANSKQCTFDEERLSKRRERLQAELKRYGVRLENYGLYPTIAEIGKNNDLNMLHFFD